MKALIFQGKVQQVEEQEFPVHSDFKWIDIPDGQTVAEGDLYNDGTFTTPTPPPQTWDEIRAKRNALLLETDWTQLADTTLTAEQSTAYKIYRRALKDLPQNFDNPEDVIYPDKP